MTCRRLLCKSLSCTARWDFFPPLNKGQLTLFLKFFIVLLRVHMTFIKVLTIHHSWIHPLHHSLYPLRHSWNGFNRSNFSVYIHVYIIFPPHSPSYTLCSYPLPSLCINPISMTDVLLLGHAGNYRRACAYPREWIRHWDPIKWGSNVVTIC
jgi:hypothetical protein